MSIVSGKDKSFMDPKNVMKVVRELRRRLGNESQQAFSNRLGTTVRTVARWEKSQPPRGQALAQLIAVAHDNNFPDIAVTLSNALFEREDPATREVMIAGIRRTLTVEIPPENKSDFAALLLMVR